MMNKHMSEYSHSQYFSFNWQNGGILKMIFPVPYSIIYDPEYIDWLIMNRKCQFHEKNGIFDVIYDMYMRVLIRQSLLYFSLSKKALHKIQ